MDSIWTNGAVQKPFEPLKRNIKTDVLIIGGGMAGVLTAHMLTRAGVDTVLVEATHIGGGVTENTTAKITQQHGLLYSALIRRFSKETAQMYLNAQQAACREYAHLCRTVPCAYETQDFYVYTLRDRRKIEQEVAALNTLGCDAAFCEWLPLPFPVKAALCVKGQAQFHPLKFLYALAGDLPIYENTKVLELAPHKAVTQHGDITCKSIIIATHFPVLNKHGGYFLKMYQHRSYVLALEGTKAPNGMFADEDDKGLTFRRYGEQLLLGGGGHRTGKKGGNWRELEDFTRAQYPTATITHRWATQDCMTLDGMPYIGRYAKHTPDLYVATGFNKWGMTSSMVAATILCDLVQGKSNPYAAVFSPSRSVLHPQLAVNAAESLYHLATPTAPRCPHMGCALKYNPDERSWDCPCHGSRFTEHGEVINNPATDDTPL